MEGAALHAQKQDFCPYYFLMLTRLRFGDATFSSLSIDAGSVAGILIFEHMVRGPVQARIAFGAQELLQHRYGAGISRLSAQPAYGLLSHTPIWV